MRARAVRDDPGECRNAQLGAVVGQHAVCLWSSREVRSLQAWRRHPDEHGSKARRPKTTFDAESRGRSNGEVRARYRLVLQTNGRA